VSDAPPLTLDRLFSAPGLSGPLPGAARYAPDGRRIAWLRPADDDPERLDLWLHDLDAGTSRRLVDARTLTTGRALSEEEKARRERLRVFAGGIVEFHWQADGRQLLFPVEGVLHRLDAATPDAVPRPVTDPDAFVTDARPLPGRDAVAFVQDRDLWVLEGDGPARRLTREGGGTVSLGLADFVAAEEMHRHEGWFASPDGTRIAAVHVDEAPIPVSYRYEIDGDGFRVEAQHYPYTGGPNAAVRLAVVDVADGALRWLDWGADRFEYLARIDWLPDGSGLLVQRQTRDQRTLELVELPLQGPERVVLTERSDTWVNLGDELHVLRDGRTLLWGSERDGPRRLYRVDRSGGEATPLSPEDGCVLRLAAVDETAGEALVEANFGDPLRRGLWALPLAGGPARRLTPEAGCHSVRPAPDFATFLDREEGLRQPPRLVLREADGSERTVLVPNDPHEAQHPYAPYLEGHRPAELGSLVAADGQRLHYRLTPPAGHEDGRRHPVVLAVYGGPGVQRVQDAWPPLVHQYFARRGWGVLELDNRGSSGRGRAFEAPIHRRLGEVEVADQLLALDFLASLPWVDAERIAVFGHSYGGYLALRCLARHPERFRAAVSVAPVTDWMLYDTHYTERYLDHPDANPEGYAASAVLAHLDGLAAAPPGSLLLMHGMADDNVLFTHTTRLMKALQDRGVQFELMTYPAAKHGLAGRTVSRHRFRLIEAQLARCFGEPPS
jgi:dipeptidyl-peptidase-4